MMRGDELANRGLELRDTAMNAAPQLFVREFREPALHEVQPGSVGGREVDVEARTFGEPVPDHRRLVRPVVVHDQMHVEVTRDRGIHRIQELPEFARTMPLMKLRDEFTGLDVERRKQGGRAMSPIVMRPPFDLAGPHRQHRLRAIQRLNLRFLVDTEHDGMGRWMHTGRRCPAPSR
jgi:hypothetical protein